MHTERFQLIYASKCAKELSEFDLIRILYESSGGNARIGVKGILVHKVGQFMQLLEGDRFSVMDLFHKIQQDTRHFAVEVLDTTTQREAISQEFMAYRNINSPYEKQYRTFFKDNFDFMTLKNHPSSAYKFFQNIYHPVTVTKQEMRYRKYKSKAVANAGLLDALREKS